MRLHREANPHWFAVTREIDRVAVNERRGVAIAFDRLYFPSVGKRRAEELGLLFCPHDGDSLNSGQNPELATLWVAREYPV